MRQNPIALRTALFALLAGAVSYSAENENSFEIADVHTSPKSYPAFFHMSGPKGGRYEMRNATMLSLIWAAYQIDQDKILGGPNWLESDKFDVIAKVAPDATPESVRPMLQTLLAGRFGLVVHKDTKPLPAYVLNAGKKPKLKEADGTGDTGCKPQSQQGGENTMRFMMNGAAVTLGPGATILFSCRNMTMAAFAAGLRSMMGATPGLGSVADKTSLEGAWNFEVRWSMPFFGVPGMDTGQRIGMSDAIDKQLGLKLEQEAVPTPVLIVDKVNEKPTPNRPGVAEALPPVSAAKEFEVAVIKPTATDFRGGRFQIQPGGRVNIEGMPMRFLLNRAFNAISDEQLSGIPKWADGSRFDIEAKASSDLARDMSDLGPPLRSLLEERFGLKTHTEDRQVTTYALVAVKPKMKKADPATRTSCKNPPPGSGTAQALSRSIVCQNATMEQFADQLQFMASGYLPWPVTDETELKGGYDFTLNFSPQGYAQMAQMMRGRGASGGPGASELDAADPSGAVTLFEAVEKQLGLKLEPRKRNMPVIVIDNLNEKPTEN
ncbi:MAG TPA: TIGR03435 family protein [Bryobacteraceae bacterium]|nr:TIGR03435 family protein [Bryobacteraceae bacterium]